MEENKLAQEALLKDISGITPGLKNDDLDIILENGYAFGLEKGKYIGVKELSYSLSILQGKDLRGSEQRTLQRDTRQDKRISAMDKRQVIRIVKRYKEAVSAKFGPVTVYLFGSYSKGNARPDSDIDVVVIVPEVQGDFLKESARLWRITLEVNTLIEPVLIESSHPSPLYEDILHTGIKVA